MDFWEKSVVDKGKHKWKGPKIGAYILSPRGFKETGWYGWRVVVKGESDRRGTWRGTQKGQIFGDEGEDFGYIRGLSSGFEPRE